MFLEEFSEKRLVAEMKLIGYFLHAHGGVVQQMFCFVDYRFLNPLGSVLSTDFLNDTGKILGADMQTFCIKMYATFLAEILAQFNQELFRVGGFPVFALVFLLQDDASGNVAEFIHQGHEHVLLYFLPEKFLLLSFAQEVLVVLNGGDFLIGEGYAWIFPYEQVKIKQVLHDVLYFRQQLQGKRVVQYEEAAVEIIVFYQTDPLIGKDAQQVVGTDDAIFHIDA